MIPPLVAFLATADEERDRESLEGLLAQPSDRSSLATPAATDHLPRLPVRLLVPQPAAAGLVEKVLRELSPDQLIPGLRSSPEGLSLKAGLYLIHDQLDASHELAQQADELGPGTTAPFWHGIMHRREPDYDNARYWFRRVGQHAIFPVIGHEVAPLVSQKPWGPDRLRFDRLVDRRGHWDAMAFIDLCEECGRGWDERVQAAAELQEIEMRLLLEYTCRAAIGEA